MHNGYVLDRAVWLLASALSVLLRITQIVGRSACQVQGRSPSPSPAVKVGAWIPRSIGAWNPPRDHGWRPGGHTHGWGRCKEILCAWSGVCSAQLGHVVMEDL